MSDTSHKMATTAYCEKSPETTDTLEESPWLTGLLKCGMSNVIPELWFESHVLTLHGCFTDALQPLFLSSSLLKIGFKHYKVNYRPHKTYPPSSPFHNCAVGLSWQPLMCSYYIRLKAVLQCFVLVIPPLVVKSHSGTKKNKHFFF